MEADTSMACHHDGTSSCSNTTIPLDEHVKQLEKWKRANEERLWKESQQQQQRPRKKVVQFADTALLYSSDRSYDEDVLPAWYTRDELQVFKQQRKEIVQTLKRFDFDLLAVERRYCLRGYEPYFSLQVNKAMKYARSLVQSLVFTEQERQWKHGLVEPEAIRESSCCASQWARDNALQLGKNDEMEVFGEYAAMLEEAEAAAQRQADAEEAALLQQQLQQEDAASYYLQSSQPQPMLYGEQRKRKGSNMSFVEEQQPQAPPQRSTTQTSPTSDNNNNNNSYHRRQQQQQQQSSLSVDDELESARRLYQQLRLPPR